MSRWETFKSVGCPGAMLAGGWGPVAGLLVLAGSLNAADIVIKPFQTVASTAYGTYPAINAINSPNADIETADAIPSPWPSLSVAKGSCWIHNGNATIDDEWIAFDLGGYYAITGAQLWRYGGGAETRMIKDFSILFAETISGDFATATDTNDYSGAVSPTPVGLSTSDPDPGVFRAFSSPAGMGVRYVLFDIDTNYGDTYAGFGEVRFTGTEAADVYPPELALSAPFYPPANEVMVSPDIALVATFNEPVAINSSGSITITDLTDGSSTETINLPDARVSVSLADLTIQAPVAGFEGLTEYAVQISGNAIQDLATPPNLFGGIVDDTTWTFTTVAAERFVIQPSNAVASSEYAGRLAVETYDSHNMDRAMIETAAPIPYPWPEADTDKNYAWLSNATITDQWITFDLGGAYSIDGVYLWNYNDAGNTSQGLQDVDISFATSLSDAFGSAASVAGDYSSLISKTFAESTARPEPGEFVGFDAPVLARYVRFDIVTNHGNSSYIGLPELRFTGTVYVPPPAGTVLIVR